MDTNTNTKEQDLQAARGLLQEARVQLQFGANENVVQFCAMAEALVERASGLSMTARTINDIHPLVVMRTSQISAKDITARTWRPTVSLRPGVTQEKAERAIEATQELLSRY